MCTVNGNSDDAPQVHSRTGLSKCRLQPNTACSVDCAHLVTGLQDSETHTLPPALRLNLEHQQQTCLIPATHARSAGAPTTSNIGIIWCGRVNQVCSVPPAPARVLPPVGQCGARPVRSSCRYTRCLQQERSHDTAHNPRFKDITDRWCSTFCAPTTRTGRAGASYIQPFLLGIESCPVLTLPPSVLVCNKPFSCVEACKATCCQRARGRVH